MVLSEYILGSYGRFGFSTVVEWDGRQGLVVVVTGRRETELRFGGSLGRSVRIRFGSQCDRLPGLVISRKVLVALQGGSSWY
jgi:hypothetical protein